MFSDFQWNSFIKFILIPHFKDIKIPIKCKMLQKYNWQQKKKKKKKSEITIAKEVINQNQK